MTRKILTIAVAVLALAVAASPALAAKSPHRYSPKHGAKCRTHYRRVKHGRKVFCVKIARKPAQKAPASPLPATEAIKLHSHLDPTYTRDPLDPFKVTYAYSASATQQAFSGAQALTVVEPAPLPSGVLSFFSDGKLECAVNVGAGVSGSECPVDYQVLGEHRVTTIYTSGEQSATETETEDIAPLSTTTSISAEFEAETPEPAVSGWTKIGALAITAEAHPAGATVAIGCGEATTEPYGALTPKGCYQFNGLATGEHVYVRNCNGATEPSNEEVRITSQAPSAIDPVTTWPTVEQIEQGTFHIRASVEPGPMQNRGYASSEATSPLEFSPGAEC